MERSAVAKAKEVFARFFLWNGQALYTGITPSSSFHQHHALQIGISLNEPLRIRYQPTEDFINCQSFIVAPNTAHQIDSATDALFLWLESDSVTSRILCSAYGNKGHLNIIRAEQISSILDNLKATPLHQVSCSQAALLIDRILRPLLPDNFVAPLGDPRIKVVIELIKQSYLSDEPYLINHIATQVYLSPSRLRHLFHDQIGISIQRYLLWQRLLRAIEQLTNGVALTQVAHETGFSDSAHMTRTFRMMFGIKPSEIFKNSHLVQVLACQVE